MRAALRRAGGVGCRQDKANFILGGNRKQKYTNHKSNSTITQTTSIECLVWVCHSAVSNTEMNSPPSSDLTSK